MGTRGSKTSPEALLGKEIARLRKRIGLSQEELGGDKKGSGVFSHDPLGRPRGRSVHSTSIRLAVRRTPSSSPKGDKRGRESFLMILSDAREAAACTPPRIASPSGVPRLPRQSGGPVAHSASVKK